MTVGYLNIAYWVSIDSIPLDLTLYLAADPHLHDKDLQTIMTSPSRRLVHSHGQGSAGSRRVNLHDVIKLDTSTPLHTPDLTPTLK